MALMLVSLGAIASAQAEDGDAALSCKDKGLGQSLCFKSKQMVRRLDYYCDGAPCIGLWQSQANAMETLSNHPAFESGRDLSSELRETLDVLADSICSKSHWCADMNSSCGATLARWAESANALLGSLQSLMGGTVRCTRVIPY